MNIVVDSSGKASYLGKEYRCALGRAGVTTNKKEGDGATPAGYFPLRRVWYRADRLPRPKTALPTREITFEDGWCDDVNDHAYNKPVKLPYPASHEKLWRDDEIYNVVVELGYNDDPVVPGKGSAIFMHVARPALTPTAGCIALALPDLLEILGQADGGTMIEIHH